MLDIVPAAEFAGWFEELSAAEQRSVVRVVELLKLAGVTLGHPYSSQIKGASIALRELRAHNGSVAIRVFYAFDPSQAAVLLIGGKKQGSSDEKRFYKTLVPCALRIWGRYLESMGTNVRRQLGNDPQSEKHSKKIRKK